MGILIQKPRGLSLLCLFIVLGAARGYETVSVAQPPSTALPPASAPVGIEQPPDNIVFPPAYAPTGITEPPSSTELPPASAPTSIAEPPSSTVIPPASAPTSISEPPSSTDVLPPAFTPGQQPVETPNQAPGRHLPPRKLVAVQGAVYCKPCRNRGVETLLGATPLEGAVVKLQCKNTRYPVVVQTTTDKNGQFLINGPKTVSTYGYHKCKVFLVSSPDNACNIPTNLHGGVQGAMLMRSSKPPGYAQTSADYDLFKAGPFAFDHTADHPCSEH
ncbi:uncharacterized protein LOC141663588 [Apium graveolens]|uniref:uncharacterized protein LOC141663588 n=1 Tax=Apium graveolens TaxID=4045 RepID=UPI003D7A2929